MTNYAASDDRYLESVTLRDGRRMPAIGFGTYMIPSGGPTAKIVAVALDLGYRHIDTAAIYGNEADVGDAVRGSGLDRDEIWVTTKLWNADHGGGAPLRALEASLRRLRMDYVDLWLMHWPVPPRLASWQVMERAVDSGLAKSIGVSNFLVPHLTELLEACRVPPAVNQIELSPFLLGTRADTVRVCQEAGIVVAAYSPLTKGLRLSHHVVRAIAGEVNAEPAQVLLRWCLQHGFVTLPRTSDPGRARVNLSLRSFELSPEQMRRLDELDEGLTTGWDPAVSA
jgi:diketogulonate reductase-like aldo/keto reductase